MLGLSALALIAPFGIYFAVLAGIGHTSNWLLFVVFPAALGCGLVGAILDNVDKRASRAAVADEPTTVLPVLAPGPAAGQGVEAAGVEAAGVEGAGIEGAGIEGIAVERAEGAEVESRPTVHLPQFGFTDAVPFVAADVHATQDAITGELPVIVGHVGDEPEAPADVDEPAAQAPPEIDDPEAQAPAEVDQPPSESAHRTEPESEAVATDAERSHQPTGLARSLGRGLGDLRGRLSRRHD